MNKYMLTTRRFVCFVNATAPTPTLLCSALLCVSALPTRKCTQHARTTYNTFKIAAERWRHWFCEWVWLWCVKFSKNKITVSSICRSKETAAVSVDLRKHILPRCLMTVLPRNIAFNSLLVMRGWYCAGAGCSRYQQKVFTKQHKNSLRSLNAMHKKHTHGNPLRGLYALFIVFGISQRCVDAFWLVIRFQLA